MSPVQLQIGESASHYGNLELELELIQSQTAQKPMLRAEVYVHALRTSQNVKGNRGVVGGGEEAHRIMDRTIWSTPTHRFWVHQHAN